MPIVPPACTNMFYSPARSHILFVGKTPQEQAAFRGLIRDRIMQLIIEDKTSQYSGSADEQGQVRTGKVEQAEIVSAVL
jgi:hypothetical protein